MTITSQTLPLALADNVAAMEMLQPPNHLPVLWLDAKYSVAGEQYAVNRGTGGSALNARYGSTTGADTNDPLLLTHTGENYLYLPGSTNNYASTPDAAALDITGDIELVCRVNPTTWAPAGFHTLIAKYDTGTNNRSFKLATQSSASLVFSCSTDGINFPVNLGSTIPLPFTNGQAGWVKATLDVDNGAGGVDLKFYYAADSPIEPTSWTQLGTTITQAGVVSIFSGTAMLEIGSISGGSSQHLAGNVYRAIVRNGIGGTTVFDADFTVGITSGDQSSFTATTGQTVTINRPSSGRKSVAVTRPIWLFGTDDRLEIADNALLDFGASDSFTVFVVVRQWNTPGVFTTMLSKQTSLSPTGNKGYQLRNSGLAFRLQGAVGDGSAAANFNAFPEGLAVSSNGALSSYWLAKTEPIYNSGLNNSGDPTPTSIAGLDLSNTAAFTVGGPSSDMEILAVAVFRRALTATEIANICAYYGTV